MPLLKRKVQSRATLSEQTDDAVNRLLRGLVQASEPHLEFVGNDDLGRHELNILLKIYNIRNIFR